MATKTAPVAQPEANGRAATSCTFFAGEIVAFLDPSAEISERFAREQRRHFPAAMDS